MMCTSFEITSSYMLEGLPVNYTIVGVQNYIVGVS